MGITGANRWLPIRPQKFRENEARRDDALNKTEEELYELLEEQRDTLSELGEKLHGAESRDYARHESLKALFEVNAYETQEQLRKVQADQSNAGDALEKVQKTLDITQTLCAQQAEQIESLQSQLGILSKKFVEMTEKMKRFLPMDIV